MLYFRPPFFLEHIMKSYFSRFILFPLLLCLYSVSFADPASTGPIMTNTAESSSGASALSGTSGTSGNAQLIQFNSAAAPTTTTIRTTGSANLGGFSGSFSSDYCGATAQAGVGGIGFGFSGGMPKIDNACVMLRTFERTQQAASALSAIDPIGSEKLRRASLAILAEIDPKVKTIFEKAGLINQEGVGLVGSKILNPDTKTATNTNNVQSDENTKKTSANNSQSNTNDTPWFESKANDINKIQVLDSTTQDKPKPKWFGIF
jgi:hypothetical protein